MSSSFEMNYPKWIWNKKQREALNNFYSTLFPKDGEYTIDIRAKFWLLKNNKTKITGTFNRFKEIGVYWTENSIKVTYILLNEYQFLDEQKLIEL